MVKNIILRKITEEENKRIESLKKILNVKTASKVIKILLKEGKL